MLLLSLTFRDVFVMLLDKIRLCYLVVSWWSVYVASLYMYAACEVWVVWEGWSQILGGIASPHWSSGPSRHLAGLEIPGPQSIQNHTLVNLDFCLRRTVTALPLKTHLKAIWRKANLHSTQKSPMDFKKAKKFFLALPLSGLELFLILPWWYMRNERFC